MKQRNTLHLSILLFLLLSMVELSAQSSRVYSSEKAGWWIFGLDGGLSYQNSDVDRTYSGYGFGFSLGKNIYHRPQSFFSADLRGRWLYLRAYGIDGEANYNIAENGNADLIGYDDYPDELNVENGFIFNNHRTTLSTLDLEFVLNLERLREKTNLHISPYAGIGIGLHYTGINLKDESTPYFTQFANINQNQSKRQIKKELSNILDDSYESAADGYLGKGIRANFMPGLGIELGYALSPRFSLVLDHRATYSLIDNLDGKIAPSDKKDIQIYTALGLRWRLGQKERSVT